MYTPSQVIELVEASYDLGFNAGARNAYDTAAFINGYETAAAQSDRCECSTSDVCECQTSGACGQTAGDCNQDTEYDASEYDAAYLETVGQKTDDLLERVVGLERFTYGTPRNDSPEDLYGTANGFSSTIRFLGCPCSDCHRA